MKNQITKYGKYECIKSDMDFTKGITYISLFPGTLHDSNGDNMHITDEYFEKHFKQVHETNHLIK